LLRDTGVGFDPDPKVLDLFDQGGCDVSPQGLVKFPTELVRAAIRSTARSTRLWNRPGTGYITLDRHHTWFFSGMTCIKVFDEETGEPRDSTRSDLARITGLVDALQNIDGACVACKIVEQSDIHGEIDEFAVLAEHTSKPLEFLCEFPETLDEGITYSSHALAFCDELVGLLRKMWEGFVVDDETLACALTREVGVRGNYLAHPHTARHCREEYWNARYYGANFPVSSGNVEDETLVERIERDIRQVLENHTPERLPDDILSRIRAIQKRFATEYSAPD